MAIGIALSLAFCSTYIFNPLSILDGYTGFWGDLDEINALTYNTQWVPLDPFCESYPGNWAPSNGATLSNLAGGISGNLMRVAYGTQENPQAINYSQVINGNRYSGISINGRAGTAPPRLLAGSTIVSGTLSTEWQTISLPDFITDSVYVRCVVITSTTGYAEFDNIVAGQNLSIISTLLKNTTDTLDQLTAANMPYEKALGIKKSLYFAAEDRLTLSATLANQRFLHNGTGCTLSTVIKCDSLNSLNGIFVQITGATQTGLIVYVNASGSIIANIGNGSGTYVLTASSLAGTIVVGQKHLVVVRINSTGLEVWVNGLLVASDYTVSGSFSATDASASLVLGNTVPAGGNYGLIGSLADPFVVAKYLSNTELTQLQRYFADKHGIILA